MWVYTLSGDSPESVESGDTNQHWFPDPNLDLLNPISKGWDIIIIINNVLI